MTEKVRADSLRKRALPIPVAMTVDESSVHDSTMDARSLKRATDDQTNVLRDARYPHPKKQITCAFHGHRFHRGALSLRQFVRCFRC